MKWNYSKDGIHGRSVAPYAGAWIEILGISNFARWGNVAPYAGAWIEIVCGMCGRKIARSLPTRERGLKFCKEETIPKSGVAPYAGAWIEIPEEGINHLDGASLPTRERGLKSLEDRLWLI